MKGHAEKDDLEFTNTIGSLKKSEDEAKALLAKAHEHSGLKLKSARDKAEETVRKAHEDSVKAKNEILFESSRKTESETSGIIKEAEKEAAVYEKRRVKQEEARKLALSIFE